MRLITNKSKNLFDYHKASKILGAANLSKQPDFTLIATQTHKNSYTSVAVELDKSFVGKTVTLSALAKTSSINNPNLRIQWFKSDGLATGNLIETKNTSASSDFIQISVTGTVPENPGDGDYLCLCFYSNKDIDLSLSTESSFSATYKDIQLEIGTEVTTYQPHTWNLLNKWQYSATQTVNGVVITNNNDGSYTFDGTATDNSYFNYYVLGKDLRGGVVDGSISNGYYAKDVTYDYSNGIAYYYFSKDTIFNNTLIIPQLYDLTLMYGAGKEPTTVDQFYTDHPELKVSPLGFIGLKNLEISNKNIKRLKYQTGTKKNLFNINNYSIIGEDIGFDISGLEIGKTYTISCNQSNFRWIKISNSPDGYNSVATHTIPYNESSFTFVMSRNSNIPETATQYIFLQMMNSTSSGFARNLSELGVNQIQIEEGSTATYYVDYNGRVDLGIIPSNSGYILNKYDNLSEKLLEENVEKDTVNYHIPDKTNILLNKVEGNTKKVVQLLDKSKYGTAWNHDGINWTPYGAYGIIHCVGKNTGTQYNAFYLNDSWDMNDIVFDDHKYILLTGLKQTYPSFEAGWYCGYSDEDGTTEIKWYSSTGIDQTNLNVFTIEKHNYTWKRIELRVSYGNEDTLDVWWTPQLFDLTAMYGRGNEPTTLEKFKQDYPQFFGNVYKGVFPTTISQLSVSNENILNLKDAFGDKSSSLLTTFQGKRCIKFDKDHNITYYTFLPKLTNYSLQFNVYNTGYPASFCGLAVTDKYTNIESAVRGYCSTQTYNQWVTLKYENVNFNAIDWYQYITGNEEIYIDIDSWFLSVGSSSKDIAYKDDKIDLLESYELNAIKNPSDNKLYQDYLEVIDNSNGTYTLKKIQYIKKLILDGNINWIQSTTNTSGKYRFAYEINAVSGSSVSNSGPIYCNKIKYPSDGEGSSYGCVESCSCGTYLYFYDGNHNSSAADFKSYVKSLYDSGDPIIVWYAVETPIETIISSNLTYSQVSALRTNNGCLRVIGNGNDLLIQPNVTMKENFQYKS